MAKKLLVADDSVTIQKVIKLALSSEGYDILAVSDGKEALRAIEEERPNVVLIDVTLPIQDAYSIKRLINSRPELNHVCFILMASAFERIDERLFDEVRFHGRLTKPFDPSHLRKEVASVLASAPEPSPVVGSITEPVAVVQVQSDLPPIVDMVPTVEAPELPTEKTDLAPLSAENDIKNLTESTIKMSGLEDFQWNLDDRSKMKVIPGGVTTTSSTTEAPPQSRLTDDGGSSFLRAAFKPGAKKKFSPRFSLGSASDDGVPLAIPMDTNISLGGATVSPIAPMDEFSAQVIPGLNQVIPPTDLGTETGTNISPPPFTTVGESKVAPPITRAEMEELIHKDVAAALEKMAREIVPQVAEAVIKREIEKVLAE